jgi:hypothetical protein
MGARNRSWILLLRYVETRCPGRADARHDLLPGYAAEEIDISRGGVLCHHVKVWVQAVAVVVATFRHPDFLRPELNLRKLRAHSRWPLVIIDVNHFKVKYNFKVKPYCLDGMGSAFTEVADQSRQPLRLRYQSLLEQAAQDPFRFVGAFQALRPALDDTDDNKQLGLALL